ncbi:flagellin [Pseudomonas sp. GD03842]|uniref:flagellin N-terminal helical domain-containing protein n=1 Tax=Pseudomonas sp. GD03842 TaxID=2975385 RepID=UPI00244BE516|nr:flagellin [Pseudomonas sp. GD03842]MDH0749156.1 flagellin [Pseudomonas sp. GD03842]
MALTVNTNIASLSVQRNLNRSSDSLSTAMTRLSSGLRINSAKDDAAGMQIASRLTTQARGLTVASRNANDAISVIQTTEGALSQTLNTLQRMRDLAVQAKNGTNTASDRAASNKEFEEASQELTRLSHSTKFGKDLNLLDGSAGNLTFHVGANTGEHEEIQIVLDQDYSTKSLFAAPADRAAVTAVLGSAGAPMTIGNKDIKAGDDLTPKIDGTGIYEGIARQDPLKPTPEEQALEAAVANKNIDEAIIQIDLAISKVTASMAELGAKQNRLTTTVANINNIIENVTASRGRVEDVDFAAETAELTKQQTLQQASTAILAQANQLPAAVLKLLQ